MTYCKESWRELQDNLCFPQCAVDGTYIPIVASKEWPADYYNWKEFYSLVMQVVVDYRYR